jgi:plastocyanin
MRIVKLAALACCLAAGAAAAREIEISQKDRKFSVTTVEARVGDVLVFRNDDPFFHNIFSLSDTQSFDLGSYPRGETRKVTLAKEGTIEVECAIHPDMKMIIKVAR